MALFSRLWRIMIGGAFAALGVLGMHYLGMLAQRMNADMQLHAEIVSVSVIVAFLTANAAFWILFRAVRQHFPSMSLPCVCAYQSVCSTGSSHSCQTTKRFAWRVR